MKLPRLFSGFLKVPNLFERYWDQVVTVVDTISAFDINLLGSYVQGTNVLQVDSSGTVQISNHVRVYADGSETTVNGGILNTGQPVNSVIRVFYGDDTKQGGNVSYGFSVDPSDKPAQSFGRHLVGSVKVPSSGSSFGSTTSPIGTS